MVTLCAPDKFRGSLAALAAAEAMASGAARAGRTARALPLADGGEGTLDALGGANRATVVAGPLGDGIEAGWRLADGLAVIEMARASGLALLGSAAANDPLAASTRGTGELIAAALDAGAERVIVAVGGSATTDGGAGALEVLAPRGRFGVPVSVACDVATPFLEAADTYAPQKGATAEQVRLLAGRLQRLAERYRAEFGLDVTALPGAGAAGGLAGGLAALGAELVPGFELVAARVGLAGALAGAELVITGEGKARPHLVRRQGRRRRARALRRAGHPRSRRRRRDRARARLLRAGDLSRRAVRAAPRARRARRLHRRGRRRRDRQRAAASTRAGRYWQGNCDGAVSAKP